MSIFDSIVNKVLEKAQSGVETAKTAVGLGSTTASYTVPAGPPPTANEYVAQMLENYRANIQAVREKLPEEGKKVLDKWANGQGTAFETKMKEFVLKPKEEQEIILNNPQLRSTHLEAIKQTASQDLSAFANQDAASTALQKENSAKMAKAAHDNNGLSWGASVAGWGSVGLAVAGCIPGPHSPFCLVGAAALGVTAGGCKYANAESTMEKGMAALEIGLNMIPLGGAAVKGAGLLTKSAQVATGATTKIGGLFNWAFSRGGTAAAEATGVALAEGGTAVASQATSHMGQLLGGGMGYADDVAKVATAAVATGGEKVVTQTISVANGRAIEAIAKAAESPMITELGGLSALGRDNVMLVRDAMTKFIETGSKEALENLPTAASRDLAKASMNAFKTSDVLTGNMANIKNGVTLALSNAPYQDLPDTGIKVDINKFLGSQGLIPQNALNEPLSTTVRPSETPAQKLSTQSVPTLGFK